MSIFMRLSDLIIMKTKIKMKQRSHKYGINKLNSIHGQIYSINIKTVSLWWCLHVLSNTKATFEAQFIKKLRNTEAKLNKSVTYKKSVFNIKIMRVCW